MNYILEVKEGASLEISEAYRYYEDLKIGLGEDFIEHLEEYFSRILEFPEHFPQKYKPYREAFVRRFPYLIIYEIEVEKIIIYSVFNTYQNPNKRKK